MNVSSEPRGFTIVELLIVIVVIAILASITIVAYNGIQQQARNSQVISGVNAYYKLISQYYIEQGSYPTQNGACLGANYPDDQCWAGQSGNRYVSAAFDAALAPYVAAKPTLASERFSIGIGDNTRAGAVYVTSPARIIYYPQGPTGGCVISGASGGTEGGVVRQCALTFN